MSREAAHARNPYSGDRRLLVALGEPTTHGEVPIEGELYVGTIGWRGVDRLHTGHGARG